MLASQERNLFTSNLSGSRSISNHCETDTLLYSLLMCPKDIKAEAAITTKFMIVSSLASFNLRIYLPVLFLLLSIATDEFIAEFIADSPQFEGILVNPCRIC